MRRRELLRTITAATAFPLAPTLWASSRPLPFRRVRPSDANWPGESEWAQLRSQLRGDLIKPQALAASCSGEDCADFAKHLHNPYFIGDQPSGTQVSGWYRAWKPEPSTYAIAATSTADVQLGVNFARRHRLRLVVKGGGHSYQGTSNAADSLLIWTHPMKDIALHDAFVPKGMAATPVPAVTIGAGAVWMDAYDAVTTRAGRYVQGGGCATVGVAGLVQSGGFGSFSKRFGSAASSLLEAEVVTADGNIRIVNAARDPELLWALKGGGGGSIAAVAKLTLATHELPAFLGGAEGTVRATSDGAFKELLAKFFDFYAANLFNPHWGEHVEVRPENVLDVSMVCQGLTNEEANDVWRPFFEWVRSNPKDFRLEGDGDAGAGAREGRLWWDVQARKRRGSTSVVFDERPDSPPTHAWWRGDQEQVGAFLHAYDSVWLSESLLQPAARGRLVEALFAGSRHMSIGLHFNKGLAGAPESAKQAARNTATNPAVIGAFALAIVATGSAARYPGMVGADNDERQPAENAARVDRAMSELFKIAPEKGSYVSESNYFNPVWQQAFWGANYPRLQAAKRKYDPDGLFFVHHGVGSEGWSPDGFERLG